MNTYPTERIAAYAEEGLARLEMFGTWSIVSSKGTETGDWEGPDAVNSLTEILHIMGSIYY